MVGALGASAAPSIIVASGSSLSAYAIDATLRWSSALPGAALRAPALGDLDGNGVDEIVVATLAPGKLAVVDTSGAPWSFARIPHGPARRVGVGSARRLAVAPWAVRAS